MQAQILLGVESISALGRVFLAYFFLHHGLTNTLQDVHSFLFMRTSKFKFKLLIFSKIQGRIVLNLFLN